MDTKKEKLETENTVAHPEDGVLNSEDDVKAFNEFKDLLCHFMVETDFLVADNPSAPYISPIRAHLLHAAEQIRYIYKGMEIRDDYMDLRLAKRMIENRAYWSQLDSYRQILNNYQTYIKELEKLNQDKLKEILEGPKH